MLGNVTFIEASWLFAEVCFNLAREIWVDVDRIDKGKVPFPEAIYVRPVFIEPAFQIARANIQVWVAERCGMVRIHPSRCLAKRCLDFARNFIAHVFRFAGFAVGLAIFNLT